MSRIRILPETVANKIAAGEVVERPASVVKELLENALDAGARSIRIETESGGKRLIRVIDDGCGMNHDDALLAFERHATSKLRTADDLLSIATLGFRGEALPTIAAISRLLLETRDAEEGEGTRIEFAGGKLLSVKPAGVPVGTSISVADIFYAVPARRKFLKSETTELGHIASLVTHYALAHPDRHFLLKTPSQEILNCPPVEKLADRVYQIFGRQSLDELTEIPATEAAVRSAITEPPLEAEERAATLRVSGFTSRPEVQRSNRNGIYIFVNRRLVRDRLLLHAISEAYRNIVPPGVFPVVLLFLDMPYEEVDVNVHPAKIEVRFRHPQFVHDFTRDAIRQALSVARPIPGFPAARAATASATGAGVMGLSATNGGSTAFAAGAAAIDPAFLSSASAGAVPGAFPGPPRAIIPASFGDVAGAAEGFELTGAPDRPISQRLQFDPTGASDFSLGPQEYVRARRWRQYSRRRYSWGLAKRGRHRRPEASGPGEQQLHRCGEWRRIVDHRPARGARARAFRAALTRAPRRRTRRPAIAGAADRRAESAAAGDFRTDWRRAARQRLRSGTDGRAQRGNPSRARGHHQRRRRAIFYTKSWTGSRAKTRPFPLILCKPKIAASTSCHAAIKVNTPLDPAKMEWLLGELAKTEYPMSCPHGRPVVLRYSVREIERAFKRILEIQWRPYGS